jgi:hypothetical protein
MKKRLTVLFAAVLASAATAAAQPDAPKPQVHQFYRLDFVLKEMDGSKVVKTHSYQMMANDRGISSIRSGAKLPVTGPKELTYIDVGVNVDVRRLAPLKDGTELELDIVAEASGVMETGNGAPLSKSPMIYQTKWNSNVEVPLRQATVIFSSDDPSSKHQLQLELTATPIP